MNYQDKQRTDRFSGILSLFVAERIETEEDLRFWLEKPQSRKKLLNVKGVDPKTADYFRLLVGLPDAAIDIRIEEFLERIGIFYHNYDEAKGIINGCADIFGIDRAKFDHSIWQYVRHQRVGQAQSGSRR